MEYAVLRVGTGTVRCRAHSNTCAYLDMGGTHSTETHKAILLNKCKTNDVRSHVPVVSLPQ